MEYLIYCRPTISILLKQGSDILSSLLDDLRYSDCSRYKLKREYYSRYTE